MEGSRARCRSASSRESLSKMISPPGQASPRVRFTEQSLHRIRITRLGDDAQNLHRFHFSGHERRDRLPPPYTSAQ
jgi:hypothetical protein